MDELINEINKIKRELKRITDRQDDMDYKITELNDDIIGIQNAVNIHLSEG